MYLFSANEGEPSMKKKSEIEKKRGRNKCKEIARLKQGEKLEVTFFNNRAVGTNHEVFARHLGIIVRDTNIVPVKVHKWKDIGDREKDHMWTAVTVNICTYMLLLRENKWKSNRKLYYLLFFIKNAE